VRVESGSKRVRRFLDGELVFDTKRPSLVWEVPYFPAYYIPVEDVTAALVPSGHTERSPSRSEAEFFDVKVRSHVAENGAWRYPQSPMEELRGLVRFEWDALSEWLEEDEPVYTHPRDPYKRVDVLASSRQSRLS
jgi:uncharacterized protein (DUF427 family)